MPTEPARKRTIAFFDGQNLFYAAKEAFGHTYPNYDPLALAQAVEPENKRGKSLDSNGAAPSLRDG